VAAIESDGVPADFSTLLGEMDFAEDGVQVAGICDIKFTDQYDFEAGKKTYWSDGTSMASPELSGKGILIQEMRHGRTGKAYTDAELYKTMIGLATDLSAPDKDKQTGWGFVDINKALQEQNPEPEPIEPPADYVLKKGDTGEKVEPLQNLLLALGYPVGKVDGDYGPITEEAVKQYQRDRGLRDTGVVDQATWDTFLPPKEPPEEEPAPQPTNRIKRFILWLRTLVNKAIYVWGAQGQHGDEIAEEWIRRRETSTKNANRAIALWKKRLAEGVKDIFAFDCSGMIVFWLMLMGIFKSDMSSRGLYARCKKLNRGELREGDLVFRADDDGEIFHVGVYTADHTAIEAKGRDDGVVERDFDVKNEDGTYYWNRFGRLPDLQESDPEPEPEPIPEPTPTPITLQATLILGPCEDNYMRIRKGPDASQPYAARSEISKVLVGEKVLALEEKAGWYRIVLWRDGYYLTGWTNGQAYKLA
jgi:cell wall-associated NlpC family hydrolase